MKNEVNRALVAKKKFSKISLTLLAGLLLNFAFPVQVWAAKDYISKVTASASPSGAGSVYVNTSNAQGESNTASKTTNGTSSTSDKYYLYATVNSGYKWSTWGDAKNGTLANEKTQKGATLTVTSSTNTTSATVVGQFNQVTVNSVSGDNNINPTSRTEDYSGTITFATSYGDAKTDFNEPSFTSTSGTGTFTMTYWTFSENTATVDYTFNGNGKRGDNSGTLSFSSKSNSAQSITITANYPAITIAAGEAAQILPSTPTTPTQGIATFAVTGAGADDDFATPTISDAATGDTWTIDNYTYADNVVTVNYTFTGNGDLDIHTAILTLSETDGGNGASNSVTLSALVEELATQDASVTDNGVTTKYNTWAQALAAANASSNNPTIKLLRDVSGISASQSITKSMTIDLNRYTLSGTVDKLLNINGTGIAVTITDSKNGGAIAMTTSAVAKASTVYITKGSLTLDNTTIEATNNYGTASSDARAIAVWVDVNGTFVMNSGELKGTTAQDYAYGLYSYGTTTINGGTITAMAALKSRGMCLYQGTTTINGGEINAITTSGAEAVGIYMYTANSKYGTLTTTGGTINVSSATTTAYGIYSYYAGNTITAADLTINVEAEHTTAYGVYMLAASTTSLTNCTINVEGKGANLTAANTVNAMGVYASKTGGKVTLDHCTINAQVTKPSYGRYAYGVNAAAGVTTTIQNNCSITATSDYQYAYGVYNAGSLTMTNSNATATTNGAAYAYGVYSKGSPNVITGNTINATSYTTYGYGVFIEKASSENTINNNNIQVEVKASTTTSATASVYAYGVYLNKSGTLTMEGNTVYAECTKEGMGRYVYGAYFTSGTLTAKLRNNHITGVSAYQYGYGIYNGSTLTSENDEVLGKTIANSTVYGLLHANTDNACDVNITGGIYSAQSVKSTTATGIYVNYGKLTATGTTINATTYGSTARGVYADNKLDTYTLAKYNADITLTNCTINATSETSSTAYGVLVAAAARENNEGTWNALSDANKTTYADTYKMGTEAVAATATINNCIVTATSATTTAYGLYINARPYQTSNLYSPGETILDVRPTVTINGGTYKGTTTGTTIAGGMYTGGNTTVTGGTFIGAPKTSSGYGIYVYDGNMTATGSTIQVSGTGTLYGVLAQAAFGTNNFVDGKKYEGHADLTDVNVTVTATAANAYAVYANAATQTQDATTYSKLSTSDKNTYTTSNYVYGEWAAAGSATIHSGTYTVNSSSSNAYGVYSISKVTGTITGTSSITVHGGKFKTSGTSPYQDAKSTGNMAIDGGYFSKMEGVSDYTIQGYGVYPLESSHPMYSAGYRYEVDALRYGDAICKNGSKEYLTLEAALEDVNNGTVNGGTIVMLKPYTLPAGNYKIPANTTLLVPYKSGTGKGATQAIGTSASTNNASSRLAPSRYLLLTIASGVHVDVYGTIEASAQQWAYSTSNGSGVVYGPYGQIHMEKGSSMSLENGAKLQAWGYITGKGEITARRGAQVYEDFQIFDWKGGTELLTNGVKANKKGVFPVNQYYIQNIESPVIYRPGSRLRSSFYTTVSSINVGTDDVGIVGEWRSASDKDIAMFLMNTADMSDDTWVRKEYDVENDMLLFTVNSSAMLSAIKITVSALGQNMTVTSSDYDLPLANNIKVIVNSGTLEVTQHVQVLPGASLEICKEGNLQINKGCNLYLWDKDEWGLYAYSKKYIKPVDYSPSWKTCPRKDMADSKVRIPDAEMFVHGTVTILGDGSSTGALYTTEGKANIYSTNSDAGKMIFQNTNAAPGTYVYQWWKGEPSTDKGSYDAKDVTSAQLKNEDGTFTSTVGANNGKTYAYSEGRWQCWEQVGCYQVDKSDDANWKWYANPSDFVQVKSNETDNHVAPVMDEDHLYPSADETRFFILLDGCMWWEVSLVDDGLCYSEMNDTYYQWDGSKWVIKSFVITWKDWNGTTLDFYNNVKYKSMPKWLSATPTKAKQTGDPAGSYYIFSGWTPELDVVTEDAIYTATYELVVPKYDVNWKNEDGSKTLYISRWAEAEHPSYGGPEIKKATSMEGVDLAHNGWSTGTNGSGTRYSLTDELPAMGTTTQTYYATFAEGYIITWKNENGDVLDSKLWATGTRPTHEEIIKESDEQYDYVFAGWTPEILPVEADAEYTAVFTPVLRQYAITFSNLNGKGSSQIVYVNYGATPVCPVTPDRGNSAEFSYEWTGWKDAAGNTFGTDYVFPAVSSDATYTATFSQTTRTYTVTWKNEDGTILERVRGLTIGDAVPDYSGTTPEKEPTRYLTYGFAGWTPAKKATIDEEGDQEYRATYDAGSTRYYTISWLMDNGDLIDETHLEYNQMPTHTDATKPSSDLYSYEFAGWSPTISEVKDDAEYMATFNAIHRQYTIVFQNENGTLLQQSNMEQGVMPSYTGATPAKTADAQYTYTFNGWTPAIATVTADATYTATYTQTKKSYTLTWNLDGGTITTAGTTAGSVEWGTFLTAPVVEKTGYTFAGWTPEVPATMPTENATYMAQWVELDPVAEVIPAGSTIGVLYYNWDEALAAANASAGCTLRLLADVESLNETSTIGVAMNLDLNSHTISGTTTNLITINTAAKTNVVTITDGSTDKQGRIELNANSNSRTSAVYVKVGTLNVEAGTIHATNTAPYASNTKKRVVAVYNNGQVVNVQGGTLLAESDTYAFGLNSKGGTATLSGGDVIAHVDSARAYGVYVDTTAATININNATIYAYNNASGVTGGKVYLYGVYINKSSSKLYVNSGANIRAQSDFYKGTYIYGVSVVSSATATINPGSKIEAIGKSTTVYGLSNAGSTTITGGEISASGTGTLYGLYSTGKVMNVTGGTITATGSSSSVYGIDIANQTATIENCVVNVKGTKSVYGITAAASLNSTSGAASCGVVTVNEGVEVNVNATTTSTSSITTAAALYVMSATRSITDKGVFATAATMTVNGGTYTTTSKITSSYGVYMLNTKTIGEGDAKLTVTPTLTINNGRFKATGTKAYNAFKIEGDAQLTDNCQLNGGYYVDNANLAAFVPTDKAVRTLPSDHAEYANGYRYSIENGYTVTFLDDDNTTVLKTIDPAFVGDMPSCDTPTKTATAEYIYTFDDWTPEIAAVTEDATYTATYTQAKKSYTLTWNLDGGTITTAGTAAGSVEWGTSLTAPVVEKTGYTFDGWTPEVPAAMPAEDATYTATWEAQQEVTYMVEHYYESALGVKEDTPFRTDEGHGLIGEQVSADDVLKLEGYDSPDPSTQIIAASGTVVKYYYRSKNLNVTDEVVIEGADLDQIVVTSTGTLSANTPSSTKHLVLTAIPGNNDGSNADLTNITISESVCIEIEMNSTGTMDDKLYYCFSVPFAVNVADGVERLHKDNNTWSKAVLNTNYRVYTYNEADRAAKGPQDSNWTLFKGTQFVPGVFYLCAFDNSNYNRYRFYAADNTKLDNKQPISVANTNTDDGKNGGWNGVANNGLTDNQLSGEFTFIQTLNSVSNSFEAVKADKTLMAIGNAAMVQVSESGSVVVGETSSAVAARRMGEAASTEFINVRLYKENQDKHVDQIFIRASEDAAEQYVAGIDLSKATMGTPKVARLWVNDYDLQLVANEALMTNDQATFSLGMSAPANGEYTIALNEVPNNATIYLTENGSAIWNLNIAPAPISLSKGTENSYGLRLVRKINNVVTGFDEAVLNGNVQKVILNDHLYIIREGKVYSAHGHVIK